MRHDRETRRAMRGDRCARSVPSQVALGALVIGMGVLFLLDNLGITRFGDVLSFWPMVFIIAGVVKLLDTGSRGGYVLGLAWLVLGAALILQNLGYIHISWQAVWPLILIGAGASVLWRATRRRDADLLPPKVEEGSDAVLDLTAILGGIERRVTTQHFRGGEVTAVMAGCELDMRGASIDGEAVLNVFALMGGIDIKCPPDWTVVLHGTPILGGFDEKTAAPPDNAKRLVIKGYAILGGIQVRN